MGAEVKGNDDYYARDYGCNEPVWGDLRIQEYQRDLIEDDPHPRTRDKHSCGSPEPRVSLHKVSDKIPKDGCADTDRDQCQRP